MHASYLSLAFFITAALTAPIAENTISGSGGVYINGQPFPPNSCVINGVITPEAQCPTVPSSGIICFVEGNLTTGAACAGNPNAIDLGPPAPAARLAKRDISGSGGVTVNGQPFPADSCVVDGKITPIAQCPTIPTTGLICVVNGQLLTGDACIGQPGAIDQGPPATPPARLAKRAGPVQSFVLDCKGGIGSGTPSFEKVNQACLINSEIILYFYCTAAEFPSLKCRNPQPIPGKPFPYPVNT